MAAEKVLQSGGLRGNLKCVVICFCMALANCQYGYDTANISSFQAMKGFLQQFGYEDPSLKAHGGWGIDTRTQQLITSFLNFGTMFGVLFTGPFARYFGRRSGVLVATAIAYAGVSIQVGTTSIAGICAGRALVGASNAFFITFTNAYVAESSPAHLRSITSGIFGVMPGVGSVLGTITTYLTKGLESKLCYQIPLACLYFFPTILAVVACVVPESPRWLLVHKRKAEAEKALYALRAGSTSPDLVREEFILMARGIEEEEALATSSARFTEIFKGANLLRTVICVGAITSRAASGLWVFLSYGVSWMISPTVLILPTVLNEARLIISPNQTYYFQQAGISDPFGMQMYTSGAGIVGTALTIWLGYRSFGRRSMVLIGTTAAALCMAGAALGGTIAPGTQEAAKNFVAWSVVYGILYGGFANMATWAISAEVVSSRLRVHSLALATGIDYIFACKSSHLRSVYPPSAPG